MQKIKIIINKWIAIERERAKESTCYRTRDHSKWTSFEQANNTKSRREKQWLSTGGTKFSLDSFMCNVCIKRSGERERIPCVAAAMYVFNGVFVFYFIRTQIVWTVEWSRRVYFNAQIHIYTRTNTHSTIPTDRITNDTTDINKRPLTFNGVT